MFEKMLESMWELLPHQSSEERDAPVRIVPACTDDSELFAALLAAHPVSSEGQLGTVGNAQGLITEVRSRVRQAQFQAQTKGQGFNLELPRHLKEMSATLIAHDGRHHERSEGCSCGRRWSPSQSGLMFVGSCSEVSRSLPPKHTVGFEIYAGQDGWTVERLQGVGEVLRVIKQGGRLVRYHYECLVRVESRRGATFC